MKITLVGHASKAKHLNYAMNVRAAKWQTIPTVGMTTNSPSNLFTFTQPSDAPELGTADCYVLHVHAVWECQMHGKEKRTSARLFR